MSFAGLAFAYLRRRWGHALLSALVGALGIAAVVTAIVGFDALPQAVAGAIAARELDLKVGDSFVGAHGLAAGGQAHDKFPYKVVGILSPTGSVLDRLVLTDIETVHYVHTEQAKAEKAERGSSDED